MININDVEKIIEEPVHGKKFYTKQDIIILKRKLIQIYAKLKIDEFDEEQIIKNVLEFIENNVSYKKTYFNCFNGKIEEFDYNDVKYRTAYGALVEGEAMCAGYAEAIRILLSLYNIKSYTILSKLPLERKKLLHYVVIVESSNNYGKYIVLDPESKQYCKKNEIDYDKYMENCIYTIPTRIFTDDVIGKDGAGMLADEYLRKGNIPTVIGTKRINKLIKYIDNCYN